MVVNSMTVQRLLRRLVANFDVRGRTLILELQTAIGIEDSSNSIVADGRNKVELVSLYTKPLVIFAILVMANWAELSADDSSDLVKFDQAKRVQHVATLAEDELTESSGLAFSRRKQNRLWTHNDSGGKPRLYAFDTDGRKTGQVDLAAGMVDWEDIAAFSDEGVPRLLVADSGDNRAAAQVHRTVLV